MEAYSASPRGGEQREVLEAQTAASVHPSAPPHTQVHPAVPPPPPPRGAIGQVIPKMAHSGDRHARVVKSQVERIVLTEGPSVMCRDWNWDRDRPPETEPWALLTHRTSKTSIIDDISQAAGELVLYPDPVAVMNDCY